MVQIHAALAEVQTGQGQEGGIADDCKVVFCDKGMKPDRVCEQVAKKACGGHLGDVAMMMGKSCYKGQKR